MSKKFFREESRQNYYVDVPEGSGVSNQMLTVGALMRIADATEAMAKNYNALLAECDALKRSVEYWRSYALQLERRSAALRGVITRMKGGLR